MGLRRVIQQGIEERHASMYEVSQNPIFERKSASRFANLLRTIPDSALDNLCTTTSRRPPALLTSLHTTSNPYRQTLPAGGAGCDLEDEAGIGPGAERGSASTSFLRTAVAGRQTLIGVPVFDNILDSFEMQSD